MIETVFEFSHFPVLVTERLTLRQPVLSDAADLLIFRGDYAVQKYNGAVITTLSEAQEQIGEARDEYGRHEGITWAVTQTSGERVLGHFALHKWSRGHRHAEAGYDLARDVWGRGFAAEALRAIVRFGFARMDLHRIYAGTIADNHESVRLLRHLGFTREGTKREHSWEDDGTFHDSAMFGLLRREFELANF